MGIVTIKVPECDACGALWLPEAGPAREDPRGYDAERRKQGLPPMRCGKCKSPQWDIRFRGDLRRKDPHAKPAEKKLKRCIHGLLSCPVCKKKGKR